MPPKTIKIEDIFKSVEKLVKNILTNRFLLSKTKNLSQVCKKFLVRGGEQGSRTSSAIKRTGTLANERRIRCALLSSDRRKFIITSFFQKIKIPSLKVKVFLAVPFGWGCIHLPMYEYSIPQLF